MKTENVIFSLICSVTVALIVVIGYAVYKDITDPAPKTTEVKHGSYPVCTIRGNKGVCVAWNIVKY